MTGRNTGMVDYQVQPDPEDPITKLRLAMSTMDGTQAHSSQACRLK